MTRYPKYKSSNVEWVGEIPEHWVISKLKYHYAFEKGKNAATYTNEYIGQNFGDYPVYSGQTENNGILGRINTYDYEFQSVLFVTTVGAKAMTLSLLRGKLSLSQNCALIISTDKEINNRFYLYYLQRHFDFEKGRISLIMQPSLRFEDLNTYKIYLPPPEEQTTIANYLDEKTAQIDRFIAKKQRLIELLKEERVAVINNAVIKGINPNPKLKPSGIDWLEDIPEHWGFGSLKWLSKIYSGGTPSRLNDRYWKGGTIPWLNSGSVNQIFINEPSEYITEEALNESSAKWIPKLSIVIALAGQGKTKGMAAQIMFDTTCNQSMAAILPDKRIENKYLLYWLLRNYQNIRNLGGGDLRDGLNLEMIGSIKIPIPSTSEQNIIVISLENETQKIDNTISKIETEIELMQEYRTALISEVVTGKVKVA